MNSNANIRSWIAALLAWGRNNGITINRYTNDEASIVLHHGKLYINTTSPTCWRLSTLGDGSLDDDHTVVTETPSGVRVCRGPVCRLKDVHYSPATDDSQKLADASRDIAELLDEPARGDFLGRFAGGDRR